MVYPMQMINFGPWHICERERRRRKRRRIEERRQGTIHSFPSPSLHRTQSVRGQTRSASSLGCDPAAIDWLDAVLAMT
jgi:hypothetical protein